MNPKKLIILCVLGLSGLVISGCTPQNNLEYENDVKPLIETKKQTKVLGSCNLIDSQSTCFDFRGEVFTEERMKLSCTEGKFSLDSCPYSDLGGCMATPGTITESIAWSYNYGGQPISAEEAGYQAKACNSLGAARWIKPEDLIN